MGCLWAQASFDEWDSWFAKILSLAKIKVHKQDKE